MRRLRLEGDVAGLLILYKEKTPQGRLELATLPLTAATARVRWRVESFVTFCY